MDQDDKPQMDFFDQISNSSIDIEKEQQQLTRDSQASRPLLNQSDYDHEYTLIQHKNNVKSNDNQNALQQIQSEECSDDSKVTVEQIDTSQNKEQIVKYQYGKFIISQPKQLVKNGIRMKKRIKLDKRQFSKERDQQMIDKSKSPIKQDENDRDQILRNKSPTMSLRDESSLITPLVPENDQNLAEQLNINLPDMIQQDQLMQIIQSQDAQDQFKLPPIRSPQNESDIQFKTEILQGETQLTPKSTPAHLVNQFLDHTVLQVQNSNNLDVQDDIFEESENKSDHSKREKSMQHSKMTNLDLLDMYAIIIRNKIQENLKRVNNHFTVKSKNFQKYSNLYQNFTNNQSMDTGGSVIVDIIINQKSDRVLCLMQESDSTFFVKQYCIETYQIFNILEIKGEYIKANKIEQNEEGNLFAVAYIDNGYWRFVVFNFNKIIVDYDVNSQFGLDNYTVPILGFSQPFATCCFLEDNNLFFNFFYRPTKMHHHFIFNPFKKKIIKDVERYQIENGTNKNFPQRCYYDSKTRLIYLFYRQGILATIESDQAQVYNFEKISDHAFGDTLMYKFKILIAESGQQILFFQKTYMQNQDKEVWINYHSIDSNGFVSGDRKINQFQVVEDANIKFYEIDETTGMPQLQNVMVNFMLVNMIIFGARGKFCIKYKRSHENFQIFKSMLSHDFKTTVNHQNFEGAIGISVDDTYYFLVAQQGNIFTYNDSSFQLISTIKLNLEESTTRETLEIISMSISKDCKYLAIIVGKQLIKDEELITKMVIMKREVEKSKETFFEIFKEINMVDFKLTNVCKKLHFDNKDSQKIIFVTEDQIITFNFISEKIDILYDFANDFTEQPEFFVFNENQDVCIIASTIDTLMINLNNFDEIDLDLIYGLKDVKKLIFDDKYFYILANNKNGLMGNFLLKLEQTKSSKLIDESQENVVEIWLLNSFTKLCIGDSDMCIRNGNNQKLANKQLLISYKSMYINVYNVQVLDLQSGIFIFRHESSCLWESNITSFFVKRTKDYISLSAEGISIMSLHGTQNKKHITDDRHYKHLVHSLPSCNYLKLEKQNSIRFDCCNNRKVISIQNQYTCGFGYTRFEDIYKLDICQLQLRELLILQSIFHSDETLLMYNLIKVQGNYSIFFKSYLELDGQNMISILAFDNNTIAQLLQDKNSIYFRDEYPLFYNNKTLVKVCSHSRPYKKAKQNYIITNAIDTALESNKIRAVGTILDYIIKYQNNYVSSYLFNNNLITLMERGIRVHNLLNSDVFIYKFQYHEWPAVHTNVQKMTKPYNGSIFDIRNSYTETFQELGDPSKRHFSCQNDRLYKIIYTLNLLPRIEQQTCKNSQITFTKLCEDRSCQDLQIFSSKSLQELIYFKWRTHAFYLHYFGALMHAIYIIVISIYVYNTYLIGIYGECTQDILLVFMALGIVYPFFYDAYQFHQQGLQYFEDPWNYTDIIFHWSSISNIIFQKLYEPWHPTSTITMSVVIALALIKTMFFLRIFDNLAYLVTLIREVIYDLRVFMMLYIIMVYMFSLILGVLGWQNYTRDPELWGHMQELMKYPGVEYYHIGRFLGNIMTIARMSIGDNDFSASHYMQDHVSNLLVWLLWAGLLFIMVIIFLNFIIAEACASYEKVRMNLDSFLQYQKLTLINESEDMMWPKLKTKERFPMYLIIRQKED